MEQQERESERESESLDTASLGHITAAAAALSIYSFIQTNSILIASCSLSLSFTCTNNIDVNNSSEQLLLIKRAVLYFVMAEEWFDQDQWILTEISEI